MTTDWRWLTVLLFVSACSLGRGTSPREVKRPDPTTIRTTTSGAVVGSAGRHGGYSWLGIPYARPPVGERRWRAPEAPEPWPGTREAVRFASPCAQLASPFGGINDVRRGEPAGSEDCLYLNVWAPADVRPGEAGLPVMMWIHGGGNSVGPRWRAWDGSGKDAPTFVVLDTPAGGGVRMSSDVVTKARVVAEIEQDARMPTQEAKCEQLRELTEFARLLSREEYARLQSCRQYPVEDARGGSGG